MAFAPKRVFILGAGFSRPAGFPLATELTDEMVARLSVDDDDDDEDGLGSFARHIDGVHQWITRSESISALNIEEFYDYATVTAERLRMDHQTATVDRTAGETAYVLATDIDVWLSYIDDELLEVLLDYDDKAYLAPIVRFGRSLRPGDTIVTFNYDRLVERALSEIGVPADLGLDPEADDGAIRVLKLHGSMDWLMFRRSQRQDDTDLRRIYSKQDVNREGPDRIAGPSGEDEYDFELYQVCGERLTRLIRQRALIQVDHRWGLAGLGPRKRVSRVPGLGAVWERARRALFEADQITVVGFSFSPFDRFAQIEFARVAAGRDRAGVAPPRVAVIDPALIADNGRVSAWGQGLIDRVESVFRPVHAIGARHENFDWASLDRL